MNFVRRVSSPENNCPAAESPHCGVKIWEILYIFLKKAVNRIRTCLLNLEVIKFGVEFRVLSSFRNEAEIALLGR